ncbi:MAG: hypothetical protein K8S54_02300 [Spirochaetia bacterium]|nr:hypothetical protein [Spirochaetia bacterium]
MANPVIRYIFLATLLGAAQCQLTVPAGQAALAGEPHNNTDSAMTAFALAGSQLASASDATADSANSAPTITYPSSPVTIVNSGFTAGFSMVPVVTGNITNCTIAWPVKSPLTIAYLQSLTGSTFSFDPSTCIASMTNCPGLFYTSTFDFTVTVTNANGTGTANLQIILQ